MSRCVSKHRSIQPACGFGRKLPAAWAGGGGLVVGAEFSARLAYDDLHLLVCDLKRGEIEQFFSCHDRVFCLQVAPADFAALTLHMPGFTGFPVPEQALFGPFISRCVRTTVRTERGRNIISPCKINGGSDEARTRNLCRDRAAL